MTTLAVVVVNYNTREHLRACLDSVLLQQPAAVLVVDNASSDGSADLVRREFPGVQLLENSANAGYGAGANLGIAHCATDYAVLLNSDTRLERGALEALRNYLDLHPEVAIVGPRLVNGDGTLQASCYPFPTPWQIFLQESAAGHLFRFVPVLRETHLQTSSHTAAREAPWVLGAALAIRRTAFEAVGGFDESFFIYYEEVDLCQRLRRAGWQVHFAPVTTITHIGGASTSQVRAEMLVHWFMSLKHYYRRHYRRLQLIAMLLVVKLVALTRLLRDTLRRCLTRDLRERALLAERSDGWQRILLGKTS
jgi:GT2 family glycosyltransferase